MVKKIKVDPIKLNRTDGLCNYEGCTKKAIEFMIREAPEHKEWTINDRCKFWKIADPRMLWIEYCKDKHQFFIDSWTGEELWVVKDDKCQDQEEKD